jgi:hypothetical protein
LRNRAFPQAGLADPLLTRFGIPTP